MNNGMINPFPESVNMVAQNDVGGLVPSAHGIQLHRREAKSIDI